MDLQHLLDEAGDSFHEKLFELIDKSGMSDVEVYKRACIDRRLFSKIRSNPAYHPGKSTVLALVFALKLDIKAARDLLARAEYALSPSNKGDLIIKYFIEHMSARAVWCYFGHDESDMVNHRYFARSIWACDRTGKRKYYSEQKNSSIIRGIWVTTDSFYESVRRLQQSELTREEFESGIQKTLCQTTSLAERYIADIREIDNQTKTISEIRETYREWIRQVYEEYFKMTEIPTVPDDLHDRFNIVEDLAGCVLDMALLLNKDEEYIDGNQWLIKNNIRKYYEGLEKLKIIDEKGR